MGIIFVIERWIPQRKRIVRKIDEPPPKPQKVFRPSFIENTKKSGMNIYNLFDNFKFNVFFCLFPDFTFQTSL